MHQLYQILSIIFLNYVVKRILQLPDDREKWNKIEFQKLPARHGNRIFANYKLD